MGECQNFVEGTPKAVEAAFMTLVRMPPLLPSACLLHSIQKVMPTLVMVMLHLNIVGISVIVDGGNDTIGKL